MAAVAQTDAQQEAWKHYAHENNLCVECGMMEHEDETCEEAREYEQDEQDNQEEETEEEEDVCICDENGEPPSYEDGIDMVCICITCREIRVEAERLYQESLKVVK